MLKKDNSEKLHGCQLTACGDFNRICAFFLSHFLDRASGKRPYRYTLVQECSIFVVERGYDRFPRSLALAQTAINLCF